MLYSRSAREDEKLSLCQVELQDMFLHPCRDVLSLRSIQLLLDCLVEMKDRALCYQHSNGRRNHMLV